MSTLMKIPDDMALVGTVYTDKIADSHHIYCNKIYKLPFKIACDCGKHCDVLKRVSMRRLELPTFSSQVNPVLLMVELAQKEFGDAFCPAGVRNEKGAFSRLIDRLRSKHRPESAQKPA